MPKTAQFIAEQQSQQGKRCEQRTEQRKKRKAPHLVQWQWKRGQSGNPQGRPKDDFAKEFARKVLEAQGNEQLLSEYAEGFAAQLKKGNAYTFKELAERGYGKLTDHVNVTMPDEILARLAAGRKRAAGKITNE